MNRCRLQGYMWLQGPALEHMYRAHLPLVSIHQGVHPNRNRQLTRLDLAIFQFRPSALTKEQDATFTRAIAFLHHLIGIRLTSWL